MSMGNAAYGPAQEAAQTQTNLMQSYGALGKKFLGPALDYSGRALNAGLPDYVKSAEAGASTTGLETATQQGLSARQQMLSRLGKGVGPLSAGSGMYAGAAAAGAREQAGVAVSSATAEVSQRNQMLSSLLGGAATSTNLSSGFGNLTNAGLRGFAQGGDSTYGAVVGGISALAPFALQMAGPAKSPLADIPHAGASPTTNMIWP